MVDTLAQLLEPSRQDDSSKPFAFFEESSCLTITEIDLLAGGACAELRVCGVQKGDRVALIGKPGHNQLALLFACWKLGAIPSPIDIFATQEQLTRIINILRPSCIAFSSPAPHLDHNSITFDSDIKILYLGDRLLPHIAMANEASTNDIALCLFTSGSTGVPKGVVCSHSSLLAGARNVIRAKALSRSDRALCVLPLSHMNGLVTTLISPLLSSSSVVFMNHPFNPTNVLENISRFHCTWLSATPTHYTLMLKPPLDMTGYDLSSWRFCRSASAPLHSSIFERFESHYKVPIIETMGMTETSGQIFSNPLPPAKRKPGSVGFPIGFDVRLVDNGKIVTEPFEKGEIQVRGDGLMSGYWEDETETAKAYDSSWLKSGDIALKDDDGYFYIVGRIKDIAIIGGINISLKSLEDTLREHIPVVDVAAKGIPDAILGECIEIYIIVEEKEPDYAGMSKSIRRDLEPYLPTSQALKQIKFVESFPRSQVGKTLKGRLEEAPLLFCDHRQLPSDPKELLAYILNIDEEMITDDLAMGSIPQWDSLSYIVLLVAVEDIMQRALADYEMSQLITFQGLKAVMSGTLTLQHAKESAKRQSSAINNIIQILLDFGYGDRPATHLILGFTHCAKLGVVSGNELLSALLDALPSGRTLIMNGFTWKFCNGEAYHHLRSFTETGFINELFRKHPQTKRGNHPVYSLLAQGPLEDEIIFHECDTCWGQGSAVLKAVQRDDIRTINYGLPKKRGSLLQGNTGLHALEEVGNSPYRFFKKFSGLCDFGKGLMPYSTELYVRKSPDSDNSWDPLLALMKQKTDFMFDEKQLAIAYDSHWVYDLGMELVMNDPSIFLAPK